MAANFQLASPYLPAGDQPKAIGQLVSNFQSGKNFQVLLGATGTGKTFTASNVVAALGKPALVLAHNETLAARLYKGFSRTTPSTTSSATTTTTSPRRTSPSATSPSRRTPRTTRTPTASASPHGDTSYTAQTVRGRREVLGVPALRDRQFKTNRW